MTDPTPSEPDPAQPPEVPASSSDQAQIGRKVASAMVKSGIVTIAIAIALAIAIDPLFFLLALIGLLDFVVARLFATGRLGAGARQPADAAAIAEVDPSYNPYARED